MTHTVSSFRGAADTATCAMHAPDREPHADVADTALLCDNRTEYFAGICFAGNCSSSYGHRLEFDMQVGWRRDKLDVHLPVEYVFTSSLHTRFSSSELTHLVSRID
jgi:hypothetical protein